VPKCTQIGGSRYQKSPHRVWIRGARGEVPCSYTGVSGNCNIGEHSALFLPELRGGICRQHHPQKKNVERLSGGIHRSYTAPALEEYGHSAHNRCRSFTYIPAEMQHACAHAGRHVCGRGWLPTELQHMCARVGLHRCGCRWLPAEMHPMCAYADRHTCVCRWPPAEVQHMRAHRPPRMLAAAARRDVPRARTPAVAGAYAGGCPQKCNTCAHAGWHRCVCGWPPAEMHHMRARRP